MSKANQVVQDRRLRPIYDALDGYNPKKAIQEADKILKKHPNILAAKVLKGLAFIRTGREADGIFICESIDVPGSKLDENTIGALVHCYRETDIPGRIENLYQRLADEDPTEKNLAQLFLSSTRSSLFKKQQQVATRMFKEFGITQHFYWGVMSIVLQAMEDPTLGEKMLWPLAERMMIQQVAKTGYSQGAGGVELHALILESMKKYNEAYELLTSPNAVDVQLPLLFLNQKRVELLLKAEKYETAKMLAEKELADSYEFLSNDNWTMWTALIESTLKLVEDRLKAGKNHEAKTIMEDLIARIDQYCGFGTEQYPYSKYRGPYMARLELIRQIANAPMAIPDSLGTASLDEPVDLIMHFVRKFFKKPSCFNDIKMYLCLLNERQVKNLEKEFSVFIADLIQREVTDGSPEDKVWAIIVYERFHCVTGHWQAEDASKTRQQIHQLIAQISQTGRSDLAIGSLTHLAVTLLWEDWRKNNDWVKFYEMILLLEYVCTISKSDTFAKLALLRAYATIGTASRMLGLVKKLEIKSVQFETLGYLTFPVDELCGRFEKAIRYMQDLTVVYDNAEKEITDSISNAYNKNKYTQIPRLIELNKKMTHSAQAFGCEILFRYLSALFIDRSLDESIIHLVGDDETIPWNDLYDNRDMLVIPSIEPGDYEKLLLDMKRRTHLEYLDISQMRYLLCYSIGSFGRLRYKDGKFDRSLLINTLKTHVALLSAHIDYCVREYPSFDLPSRLLQASAPQRLSQWVHCGGLQLVLRLLNNVIEIVPLVEGGKIPAQDVFGTAESLREELEKVTDFLPKENLEDNFFFAHDPICAASRALQTLSLVRLIVRLLGSYISVCFKTSASSAPPPPPPRGKKAAKQHAKQQEINKPEPDPPFCDYILLLLDVIAGVSRKLNDKLHDLHGAISNGKLLPTEFSDDLGSAKVPLLATRDQVNSLIYMSYSTSIEDMQTTIASRY